MNLGELFDKFKSLTNNDFVFTVGFNNPHSYRGYYNDLAFEICNFVNLREIKASIEEGLKESFTGYKGGELSYSKTTRTHLSAYSMCNNNSEDDLEKLVVDMLEEYHSAFPVDVAPQKKKRKTAAEKRAEADEQRRVYEAAEWAEFSKTYYQRLADHIYYFMKHGSELGYLVNSNENSFEFINQTWWKEIRILPKTLPTEFDYEIIDVMGHVEAVKEVRESKIAESERKLAIKEAAIAKLSEEEKQVLGLS